MVAYFICEINMTPIDSIKVIDTSEEMLKENETAKDNAKSAG